jgi:hypothetical protein
VRTLPKLTHAPEYVTIKMFARFSTLSSHKVVPVLAGCAVATSTAYYLWQKDQEAEAQKVPRFVAVPLMPCRNIAAYFSSVPLVLEREHKLSS